MKETAGGKNIVLSLNLFPVVGVGASAGGLNAFKKFIKAIPEHSGMAYVLVQHLDPKHESVLVELLQKSTVIPVLEVSDEIKVKPDHIYIIPKNKMLVANDGILEISPRQSEAKNERNLPIDLFFTSLAEVHQAHAIGVVLSGTASDGTQGLRAIKDHGGITFAQDEASADFPGMPLSAIHAGVVDFIFPPELIPGKLIELTRHITTSGAEENQPLEDEDVFKQILSFLHVRKGTDFTYYKQSTIRRRIQRRIVLNKCESLVSYLKQLRENKAEQDVLYQDLLIPVTSFFRDAKTFSHLAQSVFPRLLGDKPPLETIRVWVAGCSTGEEAYSFAICIKEYLDEKALKTNWVPDQKVQIFATDISEPAIKKARAGLYTKSDVEGLNETRLKNFFSKNKEGYLVNKQLREMCVFARHNFLKDPPFGKMDFISCRNVLIYMEPYLQGKALTTFHYALNPRGVLMLGKSENSTSVPELFTTMDKSDKLLTRKDVHGKFMLTSTQQSEQTLRDKDSGSSVDNMRTDFQKTADDIILSKYTPAGVVINDSMDIVHFRGKTGSYLEQSPGKPSHNLLKMAKSGLGFELRNIIHKAKKDHAISIKENIPIEVNGSQRTISIEAIPLPNVVEPHYLVLFHDAESAGGSQPVSAKKPSKGGGKSGLVNRNSHDLRIQQLEQELAQTRDDMRSITEEQEAVNEELQRANEELLSSSEELQSVNEELETSKEELQSTIEELMVVNQEMFTLNEQVTAARDYSEAIVATVREPLIVLDKHLRIRSANRSFYKMFQVTEKETEGRLIYELADHEWDIPALRELLEKILPERESFYDFEVSHYFRAIGHRVMLLNAREIKDEKGTEKLILLALEDITDWTLRHKIEKELLSRFRNTVEQAPVAILQLRGMAYIVEVANSTFLQMAGRGQEFIGRSIFESFPEFNIKDIRQLLDAVMQSGEPYYGNELELPILRNGKKQNSYYNFVCNPLLEPGVTTVFGVIVVVTEVTEQVLSRKRVEVSERRYQSMVYSSPSMICILSGEDLIIELANNPLIETWGKGRDVIGKGIFEVVPELLEQGFGEIFRHVFTTGNAYQAYEKPVQMLRNEKIVLSYYTFIFQAQRNANGEIEGVAIIANEVTPQAVLNKKLKESEEHFRLMADLMPAKISNANVHGDVTYFSKGWLDFTGMNFEELRDFGYHKIMHPDEIDEFQDRLLKAAETGGLVEMEMRFINKDGDYVWHLNRASPVKDDDGNIEMWVGVTTDIREQIRTRNNNLESYEVHAKELEERVQQRTVELSRANKSLGQKNDELQVKNHELNSFTYVSSHDLQEPLRKIQTFANLLLERENQNLSEKGRDYFVRIQHAANRMQTLIEDLLSFSRISSGERMFELVDLTQIIEEVKLELREAIEEMDATIEIKALCSAYIIRFQFRQLILNLLTNSLKFSKPGTPPHIVIEGENIVINKVNALRLRPGEEYCHISVTDNGIGFDDEYKDKIFELFQRLHGNSVYSGTGIGLSIAKKVVENHNGFIFANGRQNGGATFDIYVPVSQ